MRLQELGINKGQVMAISKEEGSDEEVLLVKNETETVYVLKRHIKIKNAMNAIGRHVEYIYEPFKNDRQYASVSKVQELALAALNEQFKKNPNQDYVAEVVQVQKNRAKVRVNHCIATLNLFDLSDDPIRMCDLIKNNDQLNVRIQMIKNNYVQVEPVKKKVVLRQMTFEDLKEEDLVYGVVSKIDSDEREREGRFEKVNHVFVRIAHELDILTPLPHYFNVEVGDEVVVKINQLHSDGRARGKILILIQRKTGKGRYSIDSLSSFLKRTDDFTGQIKLLRYDQKSGEKVYLLIGKDQQVLLPCSDLNACGYQGSELTWIGKTVTVKVTEVAGRLLGSKKQKDDENRQSFIHHWQRHPDMIKLAYLKEIGTLGYILEVDQEEVFLLKSDYVGEEGAGPLQVHDKLHVQLKSVQGSIIHVKSVTHLKSQQLAALNLKEEHLNHTSGYLLPTYDGVITKLMKKGAYIKLQGLDVFLPNTLFSLGLSRVKDVYQEQETLSVKIHAHKDKKIIVHANPRFIEHTGLTQDELKVGMFVYGVVRRIISKVNIQTNEEEFMIFTSIGFKLEGISSNPKYFEVEEGDCVIFKVNQIREEGKIRGRIVRALSEE